MEQEVMTEREMEWFKEQLTPGAPQYEKLLRLELDGMPDWLLETLGEDNLDGSLEPNSKTEMAGLMILIARKGGGLSIAQDCNFTVLEAIDAARRLVVNVSIEQINRAKLGMKIERHGDPWSNDCKFSGERQETK